MANPSTYRFVAANDRLFAVAHRGSYGTESGVFTTDDRGQTWAEYASPDKTISLCGNGTGLFALTSKAQVYSKPDDSAAWKPLWSSPTRRWTYDLDIADSGDLYVTASDAIIVISAGGRIERQYDATGDTMFVGSFFADAQHLVVECNPFQVAIVETTNREVVQWNEGFHALPDDGLRGPCRVRKHGIHFIASRADGIYISDGLLKPWSILNSEIRHEGLYNEFCRDLSTYDSDTQWLVATGSGIHLMDGARKRRTVFEDVNDDRNLILELTEFNSDYFVSFARLRDSMGVRLNRDLNQWETLRTVAK